MVAYQLVVTKRSKISGPLIDVPIGFPPLENLHLEMMENKKKLKSGLPLIPVKKSAPVRSLPSALETHKPEVSSPESIEIPSTRKNGIVKPKRSPSPPVEEIDEDDDLLEALGEEEQDDLDGLAEDDKSYSDAEDYAAHSDNEEHDDEHEEIDENDPYSGLSQEERNEAEKEEYIWRFRLLKKEYKSRAKDIPVYNEHSDLQLMKRDYTRTVKELYLDRNVQTYKHYLLVGFLAIEFGATQLIGIDLSGFTLQQGRMMEEYDHLLIELGEKSYNNWSSSLPAELRIMGLILFQAGIFYLGKIVSSKWGGTVADLFKGFMGQPPDISYSKSDEERAPKRKMRGPKARFNGN